MEGGSDANDAFSSRMTASFLCCPSAIVSGVKKPLGWRDQRPSPQIGRKHPGQASVVYGLWRLMFNLVIDSKLRGWAAPVARPTGASAFLASFGGVSLPPWLGSSTMT